MATRTTKFTTTTTGSYNEKPVAILATYKIDALIGSIIQLDGRKSYDPEKRPLSWKWRFVQVPIGSSVEDSGFRNVRPSGTAVSFIPDKTGVYVVELIVNDGELDSTPVTATVNIQITRVPIGENLIPDAHFLWNYISNFWSLVEDREVITTIWSSVIQTIGSDLITLWSNDNNKSLATIQNSFQRRWQPFETSTSLLSVSDQRIIVGKTDSGSLGSTGALGKEPGVGNTKVFYVPRGDYRGVTETDFTRLAGNYGAKGRVISINGEGYTIQRVSNENDLIAGGTSLETVLGTNRVKSLSSTFVTSGVQPGQQLLLKNSPYAGPYLVETVVSETELEVKYLNDLPVSFPTFVQNVIFQVVYPYTVAVVDEVAIPDGQVGVLWRIPHLLHTPSVNLEAAGVRKGDVLILEVTRGDLGLSTELRAQVVCVDRNRLGFEISLGDLQYDAEEAMDRELLKVMIQELKIVPPDATQSEINGAVEAFIAFMPAAINLATRPFTTYRFTFKAKRIIHNSVVPFDPSLISVPVLQEQVKDPPVILRENMDYTVDVGSINFITGLFTPADPAPDRLWGECAIFDNSGVIEKNFGRLVGLLKDDLTATQTRAPYLSAVRGLFFAYTNGPTVANIRLGLQILLGLPFTEERGIVLDAQDSFTTDTSGNSLGRLLVEDIDDKNQRTGFRRFYFYPTVVGLEVNPTTQSLYKTGDIVERFVPLSKGVDVTDYVKDPLWWKRALVGLEILKYFTFKVVVDSEVFNSHDVTFALNFVRAIKPAYTQVITAALLSFGEDIAVEDTVGGAITLRFYDDTWGLEACNKVNDDNQLGFTLWQAGSSPFQTRTLHILRDVETYNPHNEDPLFTPAVRVRSAAGWDVSHIRARSVTGTPVVEGDLLVILAGQLGSSSTGPGLYEIGEVIDAHTLELLQAAPFSNPRTFLVNPLDESVFEYGENLVCVIVRRGSNPIIRGSDLLTSGTSVISETANFMTNAVSIGDYFIIEPPSSNKGEYVVDAVYDFDPGPPIQYPPRITETQVVLVDSEGNSPVFDEVDGQSFRVIRRASQSRRVTGAQSVYVGSRVELYVLDPETGDPLDIFTPGMVGLVIEVSGSEKVANDGKKIITDYINSGKVALAYSASTETDDEAQAIIYF
jgi:hypothetical protein